MTPVAVRTPRNLNRCAIATRKSTVANRTVWRTYRSAVSRDSVPSSKVAVASSFNVWPSTVLEFTYSGMNAGPGGAEGSWNGSVFSHASNATLYSD